MGCWTHFVELNFDLTQNLHQVYYVKLNYHTVAVLIYMEVVVVRSRSTSIAAQISTAPSVGNAKQSSQVWKLSSQLIIVSTPCKFH